MCSDVDEARTAHDAFRAASPPALAYSNPTVFFAGAARYRTRRGLFGVAGGAVAAAGFGLITRRLVTGWGAGLPPAGQWAWAASMGVLTAIMLAATAYAAWAWAVGLEVPVRVTEEGVEQGRRVWTWDQVSDFGGTDAGRGRIALAFTPGRGPLRFPHNLWTTPDPTAAEFAALVGRLTPHLAEHHPHVRVHAKPQ
jgi:hypothetical protein